MTTTIPASDDDTGLPAEAAEELADAWACSVGLWSDYLQRLAAARTPWAVMDAGVRLMGESLEVCSRAAGLRLRQHGVDRPLLNDA